MEDTFGLASMRDDDVQVSTENITKYNELILKQTLYDNYKNSLYFLLQGLFEVIPQDYFSIFTEAELTTILEGEKRDFFKGVSFIRY